jgi:Domain of unknown function (DUF4214)
MNWLKQTFHRKNQNKERPGYKRRATFRPLLFIERLEQRLVPTIVLPASGTTGPAIISGANTGDSFLIRMAPGDPSTVQLSDDGGAHLTSAPIANLTSINVNALGSSQSLTIDDSNGLVTTAINFQGSSGPETLLVQGSPSGPAVSETYSTGATPDAGTLSYTNTIVQQRITFTGLSHIIDTIPAAQLVINAETASSYIQISDGVISNGLTTTRVTGLDPSALDDAPLTNINGAPGNVIAGDSPAQGFVAIDSANKTNLYVKGVGGNDAVVLNNPVAASGLTNLYLDGVSGSSLAMVGAAPAGVVLSPTNFLRVDQSAQDIYIDQLYELRLNRAPAASELSFWEGVMSSSGAQAVANGIERSQEARTDLVDAWYVRFLGRSPSGNEAQGWVDMLLQGNSEETVLQGILGSTEFYNRAQSLFSTGDANANYLDALYALLLNRTASSAEIAAWETVLASSSPTSVALGFLTSAELRTDEVTTFYIELLNRGPDAAGLAGWVNTNLGLTAIRVGFLGSPEFMAH